VLTTSDGHGGIGTHGLVGCDDIDVCSS